MTLEARGEAEAPARIHGKKMKAQKLPLILFLIYAVWMMLGMIAGIFSLSSNASREGLPIPNLLTGQTTPLEVCQFRGTCRTVFVTKDIAETGKTENIIFYSWLTVTALLMIPMTILGYRLNQGSVS